VLSLIVITAMFAGCAKRPATTQVSAPAPTGAEGTMRSGAQTGGAGTQAGVQPGGAGGSGALSPGGASGGGSSFGAGTSGTMGPGGTTFGSGTQGGRMALAPGAGGGAGAGGTGQPTATPGARPTPKEFAPTGQLRDIFFDFDRYDIRATDARTLDENAGWLKSNPDHLVLIEGHCDERGTNEYNLALGENRAKSTMNYLVSQGVQASRITIISYGEERPVCSQKNDECWSKNRRAHFLVKPR
jgi:peptidoglycan-associated lipoprotein